MTSGEIATFVSPVRVDSLPLNLQGNQLNLFHPVLAGVRAECAAQAKALPVVPNPGTGGGRQARTPAR
jgi:hypothetical protein